MVYESRAIENKEDRMTGDRGMIKNMEEEMTT